MTKTTLTTKGKSRALTATEDRDRGQLKVPYRSPADDAYAALAGKLMDPGAMAKSMDSLRADFSRLEETYDRSKTSFVSDVYMHLAVCEASPEVWDEFCKAIDPEVKLTPKKREGKINVIVDYVTGDRDQRYKMRAALEYLVSQDVAPSDAFNWIETRGGGLAGLVSAAQKRRRDIKQGIDDGPVENGPPDEPMTPKRKAYVRHLLIGLFRANRDLIEIGREPFTPDWAIEALDVWLRKA